VTIARVASVKKGRDMIEVTVKEEIVKMKEGVYLDEVKYLQQASETYFIYTSSLKPKSQCNHFYFLLLNTENLVFLFTALLSAWPSENRACISLNRIEAKLE
jgi:hypothetical protein